MEMDRICLKIVIPFRDKMICVQSVSQSQKLHLIGRVAGLAMGREKNIAWGGGALGH